MATPRGSARRDALSCAGVRYVLWRSRKRTPPAVPAGAYLFTVVLLLAFKALVLQAYGRPLVCPCGILGFWQGDPGAAGNSQLIADWYSASHLIFGILLFWQMWSTSRHWPTGWLFVSAAASSVLWEVIENTPAVIERFRHTELGRLYEGDSIANSMSDTVFVIAGFALPRIARAPFVIALVVGLEATAALAIRDGLVLTTFSFFRPASAISLWQRGE